LLNWFFWLVDDALHGRHQARRQRIRHPGGCAASACCLRLSAPMVSADPGQRARLQGGVSATYWLVCAQPNHWGHYLAQLASRRVSQQPHH
jgi:hypothetical protein